MKRLFFSIIAIPVFSMSANAQNPYPHQEDGFYVDQPSYAPGDTIHVHGSWENKTVTFQVLRCGDGLGNPAWIPLGAPTDPIVFTTKERIDYGSFVRFPAGPDVSDYDAITLEGWFLPTYLFPNGTSENDRHHWIVIAGQLRWNSSGSPFLEGTGIAIDPDSRKLVAFVEVGGVTHAATSTSNSLNPTTWYYAAMTYDGSNLRLYQAGETQAVKKVADQTVLPGGSPATSESFRLGAFYDAGQADEVAAFDGRLDRWGVWRVKLTKSQLAILKSMGEDPKVLKRAPLFQPTLPYNKRVLFVDFEDSYSSLVEDGSASGFDGTIVNHGTPGIAGRPSTGQGLRLNHDQVVDADFGDQLVDITVGNWPSGLFAIHALFDGEPSTGPEHYTSFVVRPPNTADAIAVIVPTNTWQAYNSWPGDRTGNHTLTLSIPDRPDGSGGTLPQGVNSAYSKMGDGESSAHYIGWKRPSLEASPMNAMCPRAWMAAEFFKWMERPTWNILPNPGYAAYTDWDLHNGTLDPDDYQVVFVIAHPEYWSEQMVTTINEFRDNGGSIVSVSGNAIIWRSEPSSSGNILEVRWWPVFVVPLGDHDSQSRIAGGLMGAWRFLEQINADDRDYVLGTLADMVGTCDNEPECFGDWETESTHPLWGGDTSTHKIVDDVVGHEADAYLTESEVPTSYGWPFGPSSVVLAEGRNFTNSDEHLIINWSHVSFNESTFEELNDRAKGENGGFITFFSTNSAPPVGNITWYVGPLGSKVLNISSTHAPRALNEPPAGRSLSDLVERALFFMLNGVYPVGKRPPP